MARPTFDELVARGKALPAGHELAYVSQPTPSTERWVFQPGVVCLGRSDALQHILGVEATLPAPAA